MLVTRKQSSSLLNSTLLVCGLWMLIIKISAGSYKEFVQPPVFPTSRLTSDFIQPTKPGCTKPALMQICVVLNVAFKCLLLPELRKSQLYHGILSLIPVCLLREKSKRVYNEYTGQGRITLSLIRSAGLLPAHAQVQLITVGLLQMQPAGSLLSLSLWN